MERSIPHVLDIFTSSPGERRRAREKNSDQFLSQLKDQQKNPGSDSAVSLGSSEDDDEQNISKYFDYLNEVEGHEAHDGRRKKAPTKTTKSTKEEAKNSSKNHESRKTEHEKDLKHIERHLSMKKTIRKKMMRDLQAAFVENPGEFQEDPSRFPPEKKSNIDLHNLTISKKRMSKSEHSFLDMLKDESAKDKRRFSKSDRNTQRELKNSKTAKREQKRDSQDDDSGNDSPTRNAYRSKSKQDLLESKETKNTKEEKISFWKRLTGKGKSKR